MINSVKIYGCGSIGNHLAHASRQMGWSVDMFDIDGEAIRRTKEEIYPSRYGVWDENIALLDTDNTKESAYDLVIVGTPPDSHIPLARAAISQRPKAILVEKPCCTPDLDGAQSLIEEATEADVRVYVGYDHVVGRATDAFCSAIDLGDLGRLETLDVEFREFWGGIFSAHPWLNGPQDSYLGFWKRGGGACGEHSHAINLWQHIAHKAGLGRVVRVNADMDFVSNGVVDYDKCCFLNLTTEKGFKGRVVQDVVTQPPSKKARLQGRRGAIEWYCGRTHGIDEVFSVINGAEVDHVEIKKSRPDDFILELRHIADDLKNATCSSPIRLQRGLETMLVIAAAYKSAGQSMPIEIDYAKGFTKTAFVGK